MNINRWLWPLYATFYDTLLYSPLYRELLEQVVESLSLASAHTLLDVGCGTGNLELIILSHGYKSLRIEAIDSSPQMINIARRKLPYMTQFKLMNLNQQLIYPDDSFDRVAVIHVLYALSNPRWVLKELCRLLRPEGILVVANPRRGASVLRVAKANLLRLPVFQRPLFLIRNSFLIILNLLIAKAGKSGYYHFWDKRDWESALSEIGSLSFSLSLAYGDQDYLVVARKKS